MNNKSQAEGVNPFSVIIFSLAHPYQLLLNGCFVYKRYPRTIYTNHLITRVQISLEDTQSYKINLFFLSP